MKVVVWMLFENRKIVREQDLRGNLNIKCVIRLNILFSQR